MKTLLRHLAVTLLLATASPAWAGATYFKATVTGTVQTQVILSATNGRIHTTKLDNKRIFQEYGVSQQDYELVTSIDTNAGLALLPKDSSSPLPTILVAGFDTLAAAVDTKARVFKVQSTIAKGPGTTLFKNIVGMFSGSITYQGSVQTLDIKKITLSVNAIGTDTGGSGQALLKFKMISQGHFVQQ